MKVQDKFISLRRMEEAAGPLPDAQRAYQAEELYHGRVGERLDEFEETRIRPIREDMRAAGLDMDQVGEYLHARHAPEANAYLQSINPNTPNNDALSGMSNQDAAQVLSQYHGNAEMLDIARQVDAINDERLALMVQAGLETQETVDTWKATYQHYVPLKRDVGSQQSLPARGQGFNIFRKESKRRVGSNLAVKEILTEVIAQAEATMVRAEKNRVGQALLNFAVSNPSPHLFEVDRIAKKRHVQEGWGAVVSGTNQWLPVTGRTRDSVVNKMASAGMQGDIRRRSFVSEGPDPTYQLRDNVVSVKVRGIEHHITFNEDNPVAARVARGMKNLGAEEMNGLVRAMATVNRVLSFVNTSGSPEFMISNFARDIQTAGYNLAGTDLAGLEARILANVFPSGKGIVDSLRGKNSAWAREFADFKKAGGKTGWVDHYKSVENRRAALESMLKTEKSPTRKTFKAMLDLIEATNMVVENAVRLSAFKHAKDAGMSRDQAASLAKNLTVNFNRKGEMGPAMNAAYLFFNAGMQGSVRLLQAAKRPKVQAMMAATVVLAAIMDAVNRRMVDDDEDGENPYDKIPPWVKERNFIIMNPWGDGDYLKIPLPWGYNVLHVAGQTIGSAMDPLKKGFDPVELALHFVSAGMDAFNPVGGNSPGLQMVAPTLLDPWVMWDTNQDYAGRPLRPEQAPYDVPKPDYLMHWKSARAPSKWITKTLNDLTGGDEVVPGAISVSPELLDLVWDQATGSMGRFLVDAPLATVKAIQGEEMQAHEIPFKRRLYGSKSEYWTQSTFYDALNEVRYTEKQKKHYMKDPAKLAEVKATPQYRFITQAKQARKQVRSLRKLARGVENLPLPEEEKKIRVAAYEDRMQAIMTRFLKRYRSATLN